jgi:hypothetical protein
MTKNLFMLSVKRNWEVKIVEKGTWKDKPSLSDC